MKIKALRAAEVAHILRRALGPIRDWSDALADMRAEKTSLEGISLLPIGTMPSCRPVYHPASVAEFIKKIRASCSDASAEVPLQTVEVEIDLSDERSWKHRKAKPVTIH